MREMPLIRFRQISFNLRDSIRDTSTRATVETDPRLMLARADDCHDMASGDVCAADGPLAFIREELFIVEHGRLPLRHSGMSREIVLMWQVSDIGFIEQAGRIGGNKPDATLPAVIQWIDINATPELLRMP